MPSYPPEPLAGTARVHWRSRVVRYYAGAIVIVALASTYYLLAWSSLVSLLTFCAEVFCDFTNCFFPMGEVVFDAGQPVGCFIYSPFAALFFSAFTPLGLDNALVFWGVVQALSVALLLLSFRQLVPSASLPIQLLFVALAAASYPVWLNVKVGSVGVITTVALWGVLVSIERGHRVVAAVLLAFAASFKFYPLLFIVPIAVSSDRRWLSYSIAAGAAVLIFVPAMALGFDVTIQFYSGNFDAFRNSDWVRVNPHSQYLPNVLCRLTGLADAQTSAAVWLFTLISYSVAVANLGLIYLIQRARLPQASLWSFQIVFLTVPFVLKTSWETDFVFLPFTQALLLWRLRTKGSTDSTDQTAPNRRSTLMALIVISIVFSTIFFFHLLGTFVGYGSVALLFVANLLVLIVLYTELMPEATCVHKTVPSL